MHEGNKMINKQVHKMCAWLALKTSISQCCSIKDTNSSGSSKLVFYAQSTGTDISGQYTSDIIYLIFNSVYDLIWVYIQF